MPIFRAASSRATSRSGFKGLYPFQGFHGLPAYLFRGVVGSFGVHVIDFDRQVFIFSESRPFQGCNEAVMLGLAADMIGLITVQDKNASGPMLCCEGGKARVPEKQKTEKKNGKPQWGPVIHDTLPYRDGAPLMDGFVPIIASIAAIKFSSSMGFAR